MHFIRNLFKYFIYLCILVYLMLGLESSISRFCLIVLSFGIVISFIKCVKNLLCYSQERMMLLFLLLITVYACITYMLIPIDSTYGSFWGFYSNIFFNIGIFFFGYYISFKKRCSDKELMCLFILMFAATLVRFYNESVAAILLRNGNKTLNIGYAFVALLPYIFLISKRWLANIIFPLFIYVIVMCSKRGAILIMTFFILYYLYQIYIKNTKVKFSSLVLLVFIMICVGYLFMTFYSQNEYLIKRFEGTMEGDMNGRDNIFSSIYLKWINGSFFNFLFGYGFNSSYHIAGNYAHNDWFELMSTAGCVGLIVYVILFFKLLNYTRFISILKYRICFYSILMIWLFKSFFSQSYCTITNMPLMLLLGIIIANSRIKRRKILNK